MGNEHNEKFKRGFHGNTVLIKLRCKSNNVSYNRKKGKKEKKRDVLNVHKYKRSVDLFANDT